MRMMINRLLARFRRPEKGWDPVPEEHVHKNATSEWNKGVDVALLDLLNQWVGGLSGKRVLDLGGGPGHYSVAFAARGADVTWYDVSTRYERYASAKAVEEGVKVRFVLGHMDEAVDVLRSEYDLVFNRICFNYGWNDFSFARTIFQLVRAGGVGYVDTNNSLFQAETATVSKRFRVWLNSNLGLKIGNPYPPHGRLARCFLRRNPENLLIDYSSCFNDRVLFRKSA